MPLTSPIRFFEEVKVPLRNRAHIRQWLVSTADREGFSIASLNIIFCSDKFLHKLNVDFLEHDTLTDVITFGSADMRTKSIDGEIYISYPRVKENARLFKTTTSKELQRIMVHGLLHLLGYSDKSVKEKKKMTEMEEVYLKRLNKLF